MYCNFIQNTLTHARKITKNKLLTTSQCFTFLFPFLNCVSDFQTEKVVLFIPMSGGTIDTCLHWDLFSSLQREAFNCHPTPDCLECILSTRDMQYANINLLAIAVLEGLQTWFRLQTNLWALVQ